MTVDAVFVETALAQSSILEKRSAALSPAALEAAGRISLHLAQAVPNRSERTRRRVHMLLLLCVDALNEGRDGASRELHWRRFIRALDPFARETQSAVLTALVAENADLLHADAPQIPRSVTEIKAKRRTE
ncbi:MAG TPA: hypothetical protein VGN11_01210 [Candidatus Baltobacteraceae bacterium]|nr:hypothetical protein [Candidatus Baltobacteraceae bacterium]